MIIIATDKDFRPGLQPAHVEHLKIGALSSSVFAAAQEARAVIIIPGIGSQPIIAKNELDDSLKDVLLRAVRSIRTLRVDADSTIDDNGPAANPSPISSIQENAIMSAKWFPYAAVAKFSVRSVLTEGYSDRDGKPQISAVTVKLGPVYSDAADEQNENWKFTKATPQGEFWMRIENPDLFKTFEVGQTFYLPMVLAGAVNLADLSHSLQTLPRKDAANGLRGMDSQ